MNNTLDAGVDAVGVILGIIFIILYVKAARSLVGSAFKTYHQWMTVGATFFTFSFLADYASLISGGILWVNAIHDILLLSSVIVFIVTNFRLPHEANKYLNMKANREKDGIA
jgi:Ca2+/Na+ antiporter